MEATKRCAACAQEIPTEATKCSQCRSRQPGPTRLHRDPQQKMIAGVCAAIARELGLDPAIVRLAFAVTALMSLGVAFWGYVVLWAVTPPSPLGEPPLTRFVEGVRRIFASPAAGSQTSQV